MQREIVQDLVSRNVRWVVIARVWDPSEPNASAISSGVTVLDEFIRATYAPVVEYGNYQNSAIVQCRRKTSDQPAQASASTAGGHPVRMRCLS